MFIDARGVSSGAVIQADIAIVGAGAAGITMAMKLAQTELSVCLLESGGMKVSWPHQALYGGANVGLPYFALDVCQLRYFGGNTNAWGGWCRPLEPIDFETRDWVKDSGWPFSPNALAPYYGEAHELCQVRSDNYDPGNALDELHHSRARVLPFDPELLETSIYRFSPPTRFGQRYRQALRRAGNVSCYLHANVLAINTEKSARTVTHLAVGTLTGVRFNVAAKQYVLAAGGIENARLLLLSNAVVEQGLGNQHDLVGRFFMEHPHTKRGLIVPARRLPSELYGERYRPRSIMARISLPESLQRRERLLGYGANIHPVHIGQDSQGWLALRRIMLSLSRGRRTDPYVRLPPYGRKGLSPRHFLDLVRQFDLTAIASVQRLFPFRQFTRGYLLESKPEQAPNPNSRVSLDETRDAFGLRRIKIAWQMLAIDRHTAVRGEQIIDAELRRLRVGSLVPLPPNEVEGWPDNLEGGWHQLGTTRMHDDPAHGVVDANARLHGTANLHIVGGSVFPTGGTAPPTLTIVALALRLAHHLRREIFQR